MKTVIISVDYCDNTGKFWFDSYIKNKIIEFDETKKTIHRAVLEECEEEGMELSYRGKPRGNIFREDKSGNCKVSGYLYRGKSEIQDRSMHKPQIGYFDVWVTIKGEVSEFEFENIND